ncbi:MAG: peroxiredoxin [Thermonema sp.]|uniref:peroxiredoxin-like family protein n=1 Tax=Thermonema sp. TaxID=2231181 RepID=UPI0021DD849C|nr:peroxiredoxin-like family protein [Thermonema sp.]GIV40387.1 MAG: peroxiredoxin [Thermonema sp.]
MMEKVFLFGSLLLFIAAVQGWAQAGKADEVCPILVGETIPDVKVHTVEGNAVRLLDLVKEKPAVIIFYRGGWCPYCNRHLAELRKVEDALLKKGYQILAISPDSPASIKQTLEKQKLNYTLLSDSKLEAIHAFGLSFRLDPETLKKYATYGIDLVEASGGTNEDILPTPAAFVVDKKGVVRFAYVNPNYKERIKAETLMAVIDTL